MKVAPALGKLDQVGIDVICSEIADGLTMTKTAQKYGVSFGTLSVWLAADPERSARAKEARTIAGRFWDEVGADGLAKATDPFELSKAKELAFHYRWRASKIAPKDYGDKTLHTGGDGESPVAFVLVGRSESTSDDEWQARNG